MSVYNKNTYISPEGNPEIWLEKPEGYYTPEEWELLNAPAEPTLEEQEIALQAKYTRLIQRHLDETAYSYGYTGVNEDIDGACNSVCTYIDTGIKKFDDEGKAFRKWRSAVWNKGYEILDQVKTGEMEIPSEEELIEMLPKLEIIYT